MIAVQESSLQPDIEAFAGDMQGLANAASAMSGLLVYEPGYEETAGCLRYDPEVESIDEGLELRLLSL